MNTGERKLIVVVAATSQGLIASDGQIPWHLRDDLRHFSRLTRGNTVVMGRKTFESLPSGPLPARRNLIVSRRGFQTEGTEVFASPADAVAAARGNVFVIGGKALYDWALPLANELWLTLVKGYAAPPSPSDIIVEGLQETKVFSANNWTLLSKETFAADERNDHAFDILHFKRQ